MISVVVEHVFYNAKLILPLLEICFQEIGFLKVIRYFFRFTQLYSPYRGWKSFSSKVYVSLFQRSNYGRNTGKLHE